MNRIRLRQVIGSSAVVQINLIRIRDCSSGQDRIIDANNDMCKADFIAYFLLPGTLLL